MTRYPVELVVLAGDVFVCNPQNLVHGASVDDQHWFLLSLKMSIYRSKMLLEVFDIL